MAELIKMEIDIAKTRMRKARTSYHYDAALEDLIDLMDELRFVEAGN